MLGQSIQRFTMYVVCKSQHEEVALLILKTVYFGSGFAAPYFL
ncbi:unnamed protein product [Nyctereutes procyonoides]|uniref:(raccoon dog) hypothetical protein n=1 Tax=Nyctereutes procyonoides TaxID=34880 RepID=A0A811ZVJ7_NYCPR|nr:unnamed protein product [Nyctereutes procyonoides]